MTSNSKKTQDKTELLERAKAGDPAARFNLNLLRVAPDSGTIPGLAKLELIHTDRRIKPALFREMRLVDPSLVDIFRGLAAGKRRWPLYLWGPSGTGKTLAALSFADFVRLGTYTTVATLCDAVMAREARGHWDRIRGADLAVLDELGERCNIGDLDYTTAKRFMDLRGDRPGRVAIYVSNLSPAELQAAYDDRIGSRALCGSVFHLGGEDRRFAQHPDTQAEGRQ